MIVRLAYSLQDPQPASRAYRAGGGRSKPASKPAVQGTSRRHGRGLYRAGPRAIDYGVLVVVVPTSGKGRS